ncbi:MAG: alanine racemase [Oscillospiraceae bacterium]|nr:alanine racemase [Oscillospiraceae bacterium]
MNEYLRRAWAEIDLDRLGKNLEELKGLAHGTQIACVVKANAYGHDDRSIAPYLEEHGITFFAVSNIKEALTLRECGVKGEILILGHTPYEYASELSEEAIIQTAVSAEYAVRMSEYAKKLGVKVRLHLAVDTGMGRIGVPAEKAPEALYQISRLDGVILDGMFTHFACADSYDEDDTAYTEEQKRLFFTAAEKARDMGTELRHIHCLNSAGGTFSFDSRSTLVRFGIMLYGLKPDRSLELPVKLLPVMDLKAAVSFVKTVPAGKTISYGRTYRTERETAIATIPIGYADGYPRELSNKAHVLINGHRAPVIGRVCMDQLMADVTGIPDVHEGSEVVLIGRSGDEVITADDLAELVGTIGYEIVCGISKRVPRVIIRDGNIQSVREYY